MNKITITVIGSNGFIGSKFLEKYHKKYNVIRPNRQELDITDLKSVSKFFEHNPSDITVNFSAKAHIDICESDKKLGTSGAAWKVNVVGAGNIAKVSTEYKRYLIHLSTECVFDGKDGNYDEYYKPNPINWYGRTKYFGEEEIKKNSTDFIILRSVLAYGHDKYFPNDIFRIFYERLKNKKELSAVNDQYYNFTFIDDLVDVIDLLIKIKPKGVYHYGGKTLLSPFELAEKIKRYFNLKEAHINSVSTKEYFGKKAKYRLTNSYLNCSKITKELRVTLSDFSKSLPVIKKYYS